MNLRIEDMPVQCDQCGHMKKLTEQSHERAEWLIGDDPDGNWDYCDITTWWACRNTECIDSQPEGHIGRTWVFPVRLYGPCDYCKERVK